MSNSYYLKILTEEEVKTLDDARQKFIRKCLDGDYGLPVANLLSGFIDNLQEMYDPYIPPEYQKMMDSVLTTGSTKIKKGL